MKPSQFLLLMNGNGASTPGYTTLFRDSFDIDESGPLAARPGMTLVQTGGNMSIVGGVLQLPKQSATASQSRLGLYAGTYSRKNGTFLYAKMSRSAQSAGFFPYLAWGLSAENLPASINNVELSLAFGTSGIFYGSRLGFLLGGPMTYYPALPGVEYEIALVLRASGGFTFVRGGLTPLWKLAYIQNNGTGALLRPVINTFDGESSTVDNFTVGDLLDNSYLSDYGIAVSRVSSPVDGSTATMQPDGTVEFTWTPASAETLELNLRMTDADNRWIVRCSQSGSTIKLIERNAGTETERKSTAQTWAVATAYRIVIVCDALRYGMYVNDVWKDYYYDSVFNYAATGVSVAGFTTGSNLIAWPLYVNLPIQETGISHKIMTVGDSKCQTDTPGWQPYLLTSLGAGWAEPLRYARSGGTTASILALQAASIERMPVTPGYVLVNVGANDLPSLPVEATWKTNMGALLDQLHAKWPGAKIYSAKAWARTRDANAATLAGWMDTVLSTRSAWAFVGPDESIVIKGADDGATNSSDGIHYSNPAGNTAIAAAWKNAMGL